MPKIIDMPEQGTLAYEIVRNAVFAPQGKVQVSDWHSIVDSVLATLKAQGIDPHATPAVGASVRPHIECRCERCEQYVFTGS